MDVCKVDIVTLLVIFSLGHCLEATMCKTDSDCGAGQCCFKKPPYAVPSKRRQALPVSLEPGKCEIYRDAFEECSIFEQGCGCIPGYVCGMVPMAPRATPIASRKRFMWYPDPGTEFRCKRI